MLEGSQVKLKRHFKAHHRGLEPTFLGFGDVPPRCIYGDYEHFLLRTDKPELWEKQTEVRRTGRPSKSQEPSGLALIQPRP